MKANQINSEVRRFRHIAENNYIEKQFGNGFERKENYFLDTSDIDSRIASAHYYQMRSSTGSDFGWVDVELPGDVFRDLENKGLVKYSHKTEFINNEWIEFDEIIFQPRAENILNQYRVEK